MVDKGPQKEASLDKKLQSHSRHAQYAHQQLDAFNQLRREIVTEL